jgi:hypothetical protein
LIFYFTQVEAPPDSPIRPGPVFSHLEDYYGRTRDEALKACRETPALRADPGPMVVSFTQKYWIEPLLPLGIVGMQIPLPKVAVATFAADRQYLQDVEWNGVFGFDDESETKLKVPPNITPQFFVLQPPSVIYWFNVAGRHQTSIPVLTKAASEGGAIPVVDLDPSIPFFHVTAGMVFPADDNTDALFASTRETTDDFNNLGTFVNFDRVRWVRPENTRVFRMLS